MARRIKSGRRREDYPGVYGPASLLTLLVAACWAWLLRLESCSGPRVGAGDLLSNTPPQWRWHRQWWSRAYLGFAPAGAGTHRPMPGSQHARPIERLQAEVTFAMGRHALAGLVRILRAIRRRTVLAIVLPSWIPGESQSGDNFSANFTLTVSSSVGYGSTKS